MDAHKRQEIGEKQKSSYKIFDFFANFEYFEHKFNYDEVIELPREHDEGGGNGPPLPTVDEFNSTRPDLLATHTETAIGPDGMKIDRMYFEKFEEKIKADPVITDKVEKGQWDELLDYLEHNILNKPEEFFTLDKLRKAFHVDRRISMREIIEKIFGMIPYFKSKNELLDEEFDKFDSRYMPKEEYFEYARTVFKAYVLDNEFRAIIDNGNYALLNINPSGQAFKKLSPELRKTIPEYIKDFVPLNKFAA
jgi:type I restriction enzyme R subunit